GDGFIFTYVSAEPLGDRFEELPDNLWIGNLTEDEETSELMADFATAARGLHKQFSAPQDTPDEVVDVLRSAIADTVEDPEFLAQADQQNRLIDFLPAEEVERRIQAALDIPDDLRQFVASVLLEGEE